MAGSGREGSEADDGLEYAAFMPIEEGREPAERRRTFTGMERTREPRRLRQDAVGAWQGTIGTIGDASPERLPLADAAARDLAVDHEAAAAYRRAGRTGDG